MKRLPPSQREKQRYLGFRIHSEDDLEIGDIVEAVWSSVLRYMGTKGAGESNFWVIGNKFDEESQEGVIRVRRDYVEDVRAALVTQKHLSGTDGFIEITGVSGSMKSLGSRRKD
ncbi:MAG: Rpp14/Pop5 family protein [Candidatus Nanohaloarchaea archaeon]